MDAKYLLGGMGHVCIFSQNIFSLSMLKCFPLGSRVSVKSIRVMHFVGQVGTKFVRYDAKYIF